MSKFFGDECVWIGSIPYSATEDDVKKEMGKFGHVVEFEFVKKGNGHNGQAFCQYLDKQTADEARSMSKKVYVKGRALIIDSCQGSGKAKNTNIAKLYSENLSKDECYRLVVEFQNLVKSDPEQAKEYLRDFPGVLTAIDEILSANNLKTTVTN